MPPHIGFVCFCAFLSFKHSTKNKDEKKTLTKKKRKRCYCEKKIKKGIAIEKTRQPEGTGKKETRDSA